MGPAESALHADRLPLPVARLQVRSRNAKSPRERHDNAYFAFEVSLRLGLAAHPPDEPSALARATIGQWVQAMRLPDTVLDSRPLLELYGLLSEVGLGKRAAPTRLTPRRLLDALPAYRNRVVGHGAPRDAAFYEETANLLLAGLESAWRHGAFLGRHADVVYVGPVVEDAERGRVAQVLELRGESSRVGDLQGTAIPEHVRAGRLYLRSGDEWQDLHPWFIYLAPDEKRRESVLCFNGVRRRAEYLDYTSGEFLRGDALEAEFPGIEAEVREFFSAPEAVEEPPAEEDPNRFGDYRIVGKLGEGGMGIVYMAQQVSLGRHVALKMLQKSLSENLTAVARFQREIAVLSRCEHPNVVKILASGYANETWYYAMEYVEGVDLAQVAQALSKMDDFDNAVSTIFEQVKGEHEDMFADVPEIPKQGPTTHFEGNRYRQLANFFRDASRGLHHLHENGIVHRDIKPGNLMVTHPDQRAVIMDLGLAAVEDASLTLTREEGQILGTLRYMAPEQVERASSSIDRRADIYSLGATLYELLCDSPFHDGESVPRLIDQVLHEKPRPIESFNAAVPKDLVVIVGKATQKDPGQRYDTAESLARDLDNYLAHKPISARPPSLGYVIKLAVKRNKALTATIAAALILAVTMGVIFLKEQRRSLDVMMGRTLAEQEDELYPVTPAIEEDGGIWLDRSRALIGKEERYLDRLPDHPASEDSPREREERRLLENIRFLASRYEVVAQRVDVASNLRRLSIEEEEGAWKEAVARVLADGSPYSLAEFAPQVGLVPLGPDPGSGFEEFWLLVSGERPMRSTETGRLQINEESGIVLVLLPGEPAFAMGSLDKEKESKGRTCTKRLHAFFMSKYETTQSQWVRWMTGNPSFYAAQDTASPPNGRHPVEQVTWDEAMEFCRRISVMLPTEAQWEYACRAGTDTFFSFGDDVSDLCRNEFVPFLCKTTEISGVQYAGHAPVGSLNPNRWGLFDMHGNLTEWCVDDYLSSYSDDLTSGDGRVIAPSSKHKALRGASWSLQYPLTPRQAGSFLRQIRVPKTANWVIGFRVARPLDA